MENTIASAKNEFARKTDSFVDRAENKAGELATKAKSMMDSDWSDQLSQKWNQFREQSTDVYNSSVDVVRRHPVATVGTVLAVGVLAGMILKRNHH
jgi:ElaB/YqjD/DUF883 family membrane-anchored ribosome-binding protein